MTKEQADRFAAHRQKAVDFLSSQFDNAPPNSPYIRDLFGVFMSVHDQSPNAALATHVLYASLVSPFQWAFEDSVDIEGKIKGVVSKHDNSAWNESSEDRFEFDDDKLTKILFWFHKHAKEIEDEVKSQTKKEVVQERREDQAGEILGDIVEAQQLILFKEYIK